MRQIGLTSAVLAASMLFFACTDSSVYNESRYINEELWQPDDTLKFTFPVTEPSKQYDLYFEAEVSKHFKTQNLWLFFEAEAPDGTTQNDTIEYFLFDNKGQPFGPSSGDNISYDLFYKAVVSFPQKGTYRLRVQQGMRPGQEPLMEKLTLVIRESKQPKDE